MKASVPYKLLAILAIFVAAPFAAYGDSAAQQKTPAAASSPQAGAPCPSPPPCGANCSKHPFAPTDCWTTPNGPAKADVIIGVATKSTNMLYCNGGTYALCFFSGPPKKTGTNPANKPLPCVPGRLEVRQHHQSESAAGPGLPVRQEPEPEGCQRLADAEGRSHLDLQLRHEH
jgi:hypothetical protein